MAAIDIGTNTVLLLIAERRVDGTLSAVTERATITRLGENVDNTRRLSDAAIERTCVCLDEYAVLLHACGAERIAVVGTSAMRDAGGGERLRQHVRAKIGVDAHVVSGEEEARLTFRGALSGLDIDANEDVAVFDIGGGSTEVVLGRFESGVPRLRYTASIDVGSVRLTERHMAHGSSEAGVRDFAGRVARSAFEDVPPLAGIRELVGIAGTMTTLAAVALGIVPYDGGRVHGQRISRKDLSLVIDRLANLDLMSRQRVPGMEPKRADVIVTGGAIAMALLDHWDAEMVRISDRGVRWGLAEELASSRA